VDRARPSDGGEEGQEAAGAATQEAVRADAGGDGSRA
jgi:hypothetical protein